MNTDTLTHPITQVVAGAAPIAASMPDMHSVGNTIISYGGALLASTLIHLFFNLISKFKKSNVTTSTATTDQTNQSN